MKCILAFFAVLYVSISVHASSNPCSDSLYVELCNKPLQSMSAGEAVYFIDMKKACEEYREDIARSIKVDSTFSYVNSRIRKGIRTGGKATLLTCIVVGLVTAIIVTAP